MGKQEIRENALGIFKCLAEAEALVHGIVSFEEGGRIMMDFTDVGEGEIESGKDVKMVFRVKAIDEARGFTRYFWKAVPI